jgi:hypothetical protein
VKLRPAFARLLGGAVGGGCCEARLGERASAAPLLRGWKWDHNELNLGVDGAYGENEGIKNDIKLVTAIKITNAIQTA